MLPDTDLAGAKVNAEQIRAAVADIKPPGVDLGAAMNPETVAAPGGLSALSQAPSDRQL